MMIFLVLTARTTLGRSAPWYPGRCARTPASRVPTVTSAHNSPVVVATPGAPPTPAPTSTPLLLTAHWVAHVEQVVELELALEQEQELEVEQESEVEQELQVEFKLTKPQIFITASHPSHFIINYGSYCQYVLQQLPICMIVTSNMYYSNCQYV